MAKDRQQFLNLIKRLNVQINNCYRLIGNDEWYEYACQLMQNNQLPTALARINKDQASLQEITAFIQQVKKLFLAAKQDSEEFNQILKDVEQLLYDAVYEELKTVVTTKPHNAAIVRLWLRPEDIENPNRKILGMASGGHLAVELNVNFYQHYFSFVTDGSLVGEETGLGKAAKVFSVPSPDSRKGIFVGLDQELKRLFSFDPHGSYADLQEVVIPCDYAGVPVGLSENKLVGWANQQLKNPNLKYGFYSNNCATVVANALKIGNAEHYKSMPFTPVDIKAPREVFQYAKEVAVEISQLRQLRANDLYSEQEAQEYFKFVDTFEKDKKPPTLREYLHQEALLNDLVKNPEQARKLLRPRFLGSLFSNEKRKQINQNIIVKALEKTEQDQRYKSVDQLFKKPKLWERALDGIFKFFGDAIKSPLYFRDQMLADEKKFNQLVVNLLSEKDQSSLDVLEEHAKADRQLLLAYSKALYNQDEKRFECLLTDLFHDRSKYCFKLLSKYAKSNPQESFSKAVQQVFEEEKNPFIKSADTKNKKVADISAIENDELPVSNNVENQKRSLFATPKLTLRHE